MLVDSHCHLDFPDLVGRLPELLQNMSQAGVTRALCVAVNLEDFGAVLALARSDDRLCASVGVHPDYADVTEPDVEMLLRLFPKLTPLEQEILTLHYWEKLRFDDIASRKNVSTNTVRYHWHQSLEKLSQKMQPS